MVGAMIVAGIESGSQLAKINRTPHIQYRTWVNFIKGDELGRFLFRLTAIIILQNPPTNDWLAHITHGKKKKKVMMGQAIGIYLSDNTGYRVKIYQTKTMIFCMKMAGDLREIFLFLNTK